MSHEAPPIPREQTLVPPGHAWARLPLAGAGIGVIGLLVLALARPAGASTLLAA